MEGEPEVKPELFAAKAAEINSTARASEIDPPKLGAYIGRKSMKSFKDRSSTVKNVQIDPLPGQWDLVLDKSTFGQGGKIVSWEAADNIFIIHKDKAEIEDGKMADVLEFRCKFKVKGNFPFCCTMTRGRDFNLVKNAHDPTKWDVQESQDEDGKVEMFPGVHRSFSDFEEKHSFTVRESGRNVVWEYHKGPDRRRLYMVKALRATE